MTHTDTTLSALLYTIVADPSDMTVRLICADWLMEHGDPRGEFIALQLDIDGIEKTLAQPYEDVDLCTGISASWCPVCGDCCCPDREESMDYHGCPLHHHRSRHSGDDSLRLVLKELKVREQRLLGPNWGQWMPRAFAKAENLNGFQFCTNLYPTPPCPTPHITFRRGFVEIISLPCASWHSHGPQIVRQTPVTQVRLVDYDSVQLLGDYYAVMPLVVRYSWITGLAHLFASEEEAKAENERRALQWARATAGLPRWEVTR